MKTMQQLSQWIYNYRFKGSSLILLVIVFLLLSIRAIVLHTNAIAIASHDGMFFSSGTGSLLEQLVTTQATYEKKIHDYDRFMQKVFPSTLSTTDMVRSITTLLFSLNSDIRIQKMAFPITEIGLEQDAKTYPMDLEIEVSKEGLVQVLDRLKHTGDYDTSLGVIPFIRVHTMEIIGDLADQYDAAGNKRSSLFVVRFRLLFYGQL